MADGFIKRLLTRKNLILGGQLAGLALAFSSKKVRDGAAEAAKAAGGALKKADTGASAPSVEKTVNALVSAPAVAAAAPKATRTVKAAAKKAAPARTKVTAKKAAAPKRATAKAASAKVAPAKAAPAKAAATKSAAPKAKPGPKPKATTAKPKATRAKAKPKD